MRISKASPPPLEANTSMFAHPEYDRGANSAGNHDMLVGGLWFLGGVIVTVVTFSTASSGGHYVVAWGAIVFGAIQFLRGVASR